MTTPQAQRRRQREIIWLLVIVAAILVVATARQTSINSGLHDNVDVIHDSQIQACEASLKPGGVRRVIAQQIQAQLDQAKRLDYSKFFPNVPEDELKQLLAQSRQRRQQEIHDLLDVDCHAIYPKP